MRPEQLRKRLGMSRADLARALNVTERTVARWDDGTAPQGLAAEVLRGVAEALARGAEPEHVAQHLRLGVGSLLRLGFTGSFPYTANRTQ